MLKSMKNTDPELMDVVVDYEMEAKVESLGPRTDTQHIIGCRYTAYNRMMDCELTMIGRPLLWK